MGEAPHEVFSQLDLSIAEMFNTPSGKIVLKDLNDKLKEPSWEIGEPMESAIYREGSRNAIAWLVDINNKVNKG